MCECESDYYDLDNLKKMKTASDRMIDPIRFKNNKKIRQLQEQSVILKKFNVVTTNVIRYFESEAISYIKHLLNNGKRYKTLYWLDDNIEMFNKIEIDYSNFVLMNDKKSVLSLIERKAKYFFEKDSLKFKITVLYLLYFYALIVNEDSTWILIDYLNLGNVHHQYFIENE